MKLDDLKRRIDELIAKGDSTLATKRRNDWGEYVETKAFNEFRSASLSFILSTYGENWPYYKDFNEHVADVSSDQVKMGLGILRAIKDEINGGWFFTTKGLVSAELFSDFLDMAEYLLSEGYKDAAAVIIGSVLEEQLRQLCQKNSLPIEVDKNGKMIKLKADALNSSLCSTNVYNKLDQKSVTAWLDLRNKAAHGLYNEYTLDQVRQLIEGVINFIVRNSL
jgi:hypothetical protein